MSTFVIAEIGSCHENSLEKAIHLIGVAAVAGANAAKFQLWLDPERLAKQRELGPEAVAIYTHYQLPKIWLPQLAAVASVNGLEFMCTSYDAEGLNVIVPFVERFKIASYESEDLEFFGQHIAYHRPIYASVAQWAAHPLRHYEHPLLMLLHCVQQYPCVAGQAGLARLKLRNELGHTWRRMGYSDHTGCELAGAIAVACGAPVVEAHLRDIDTPLDNPDYPHSLEPSAFGRYVQHIREAEQLMGVVL